MGRKLLLVGTEVPNSELLALQHPEPVRVKALLDGGALLESLAGSHRASPIILSDRQLLMLLLLGFEVGG